jgi:hypothetical protein
VRLVFSVSTKIKIVPPLVPWVYVRHMLEFKSGEVLACPRVDEMPIPATRSFICQCSQCGTRIWVAHSSPIEPIRLCLPCSAAHTEQRQASAHSSEARK